MKNYITKHRYIVALVGGGLISLVPLFMIHAIISLFPSLAPEGLETVSKFFSGEFGIIQLIRVGYTKEEEDLVSDLSEIIDKLLLDK